MAEDRRRDVATAATGALLLGTGGATRHIGVHAAYPKAKPKIHALGMLRAAKGKRLYFGGSALGALGLAPLAVGTTHAVRGRVDKADDDQRRGFWREGFSGTKDALHERATSTFQPVPAKLRAAQLGAGGAAGALGSLAARAALGRKGNALKPLLTPVAGGLAATASVPVTNRAVRRRYPDYEVTASGVRRRKTAAKRPSSKASTYRPQPRSFRTDLNKASPLIPKRFIISELSGNGHVSGAVQSALADVLRAENKPKIVIIAAVDGGPKGLKVWRRSQGLSYEPEVRYQWVRKAEDKRYLGARTPYIRQRAAVTAASHPPVVGPFASAALAGRYAPPGQSHRAAARQYGMSSVAPLPAAAAGAYAGAHLTQRSKTAEGVANDVLRVKHHAETRLRRVAGLPEKKEGSGLVARQTTRFVGTKAGKPFRTKAGAVGGAVGFLGAKMAAGGVGTQTAISLNQRDQRRYNLRHEITKAAGPGQTKHEKHTLAQRKRRSAALSVAGGTLSLTSLGLLAAGKRSHALTTGTLGSGLGGVNALLGARVQRQEAHAVDPVKKSDAIPLRNSKKQNADLIRRYGDRGPLPKKLDRDTRMSAYEARYVHHGGQHQNAWSRRADAATGVKNAGLAVATAGGGAWLATRGKRGRAALLKHPMLRHHAETAAGAGAVAGGLGEMAAGYAHHRQSSYAHSPGGVAASALRRMRDYTPEGQ